MKLGAVISTSGLQDNDAAQDRAEVEEDQELRSSRIDECWDELDGAYAEFGDSWPAVAGAPGAGDWHCDGRGQLLRSGADECRPLEDGGGFDREGV